MADDTTSVSSPRKRAKEPKPAPPPEPQLSIREYIAARQVGRRAQITSLYIAKMHGGEGVTKTLAEWDALHGRE